MNRDDAGSTNWINRAKALRHNQQLKWELDHLKENQSLLVELSIIKYAWQAMIDSLRRKIKVLLIF